MYFDQDNVVVDKLVSIKASEEKENTHKGDLFRGPFHLIKYQGGPAYFNQHCKNKSY